MKIRMAHQGSLRQRGKTRRHGPRVEQVWKCTKRTNLYFDKQINYKAPVEVSVQKRLRMEEGKKKHAKVDRKFGIMKWSQSPVEKKDGSEYFVMEVGRSCIPHKHRIFFFFFFFFF